MIDDQHTGVPGGNPSPSGPTPRPADSSALDLCGAAIARERETRHWTIAQFRESFGGDHWPSEVARIASEADAAVDFYIQAVKRLLEVRADAEKQAKRASGEGYTYEQGRIAAVDEVLDAAS